MASCKYPPALDIIIVNWNSGAQLRHCLHSIKTAEKSAFTLQRVVVVDNASMDGSADALSANNLPLLLVRNEANRGFAAACNQGAVGSAADCLLFLNPDVILFSQSLVAAVRYLMAADASGIGILGIQLIDRDGRVSRNCARFPTLRSLLARVFGLDRLFPARFLTHFMTEWDHAQSREVDQVMGAFFLVKRHLFEKLNGFDERFFVYFEDADFAYRAKAARWSSYYLASASAFHRGCGTTDSVRYLRLFYSLRSRVFYCYKHFSRCAAAALVFATLVLEPFSRLASAIARGSSNEIRQTFKGYYLLWKEIPAIVNTAAYRGTNESTSA